MAHKRTINLAVPEPLLDEFNEVCSHYGHAKQKGLVLSAAILMFLEAHPEEQGKALERILVADVRSGIQSMVKRAREHQADRIAQVRDAREQADCQAPQGAPGMLRAAKLAGQASRPLHEVPEMPGGNPAEEEREVGRGNGTSHGSQESDR